MKQPPYLHIEKTGLQGEPLVLLHGWGQTMESLQPLAQLLAHKHQVFLVDLPGFGRSTPPAEVWDTFQFADYIVQHLHNQNIHRFSLLGHSFGGKIAMSLAVNYPKKVSRLVLMGASGLKKKRSLLAWLRFQGIKNLGKGIKQIDKLFKTDWFQHKFVPRFGSKDYQLAGVMRPILVKSVNEDFTAHLSKISSPTLILWGEEDQETPLEIAYRLQKGIKDAQLKVFSGKGHYIFQDCGSHLCASKILPFLNRAAYG